MRKLIVILFALTCFSGYGQHMGIKSGGGLPGVHYDPSLSSPAGLSFSNGNLKVVNGGGRRVALTNKTFSSASVHPLIYWERTVIAGSQPGGGIAKAGVDVGGTNSLGGDNFGWSFIVNGVGDPYIFHNNVATAYGVAYGPGDIIGYALDLTNGFLYFRRNGTWLNGGIPTSGALGTGAAFSGLSGSFYLADGEFGGTTFTHQTNFGETPFTYTIPAGYNSPSDN